MTSLNDQEPVLFSFDHDSSIASITLNRPLVLNAINVELLDRLVLLLKEVKDISPKVCIICGSGPSFCSGEDLKETLAPNSKGTDPDELRHALEQLQRITALATGTGTVYIAAVSGWAIGGGAEICLAADVVLASPDAKFRFPEIVHGHAPTGGITGRLPQLIGLQRAKQLMLFGGVITAAEALTHGMVMEVVDDPLSRARELARQLSEKSGRSLASIKLGLEKATFPNAQATLDFEVKSASWCFADDIALDAFHKFKNRKSIRSMDTKGELTLPHLLRNTALDNPDKIFLRVGSVQVTYARFARDTFRLASGLLKHGVNEGDVISAVMLNSEVMVRFWFASMAIGAIWAPLHTEFKGTLLKRTLGLLEPKILIVDDNFSDFLPTNSNVRVYSVGEANRRGNSWEELIDASPYEGPFQQSPQATCSLLFTSGTTGPSKACELSHQYFTSAARALIESFGLTANDVLFCPFPLCHADATSFTVVPALLLGATAVISTRFSASRWWDEVREAGATVADFMGATLSILYKAPHCASDAENPLRLMWGVPVPSWVENFEQRFNLMVREVYGSTETGLPVVQPMDRPRIEGSCGVARKGVQLKIINEDGSSAKPGVTGELLVCQPKETRFTGYYKEPEATANALRDGWFHTGDLCKLDADGNLSFVGRKKQVIRRRGENISAFEVEEAFMAHPDVLECAAYGVPCSELTEEDLALSVVKRSGSSITEKKIYDFALKIMPRFFRPRYINFADELPRTQTGKLEVFKLKEFWESGNKEFFDSESLQE